MVYTLLILIAQICMSIEECQEPCDCWETTAFCANHNLTNVQFEAITLPNTTEKLYLGSNKFTEVPVKAIEKLPRLKLLNLDSNMIRSIPKHIKNNQLKEMVLKRNEISRVFSDDLQGVKNLDLLVLDENKIKSLPDSLFSNLGNLHGLSLLNNQISTISPGAFQKLKSLSYIYLNNNNITAISSGTFQNIDLNQLLLNNNRLQRIPSDISTAFLELDNNNVSRLSAMWFTSKTKMHTLSLKGNNITCDCSLMEIKKRVLKLIGTCADLTVVAGNALETVVKNNSLRCNACSINPCTNGGKCNVTSSNFTCTCATGFKGRKCKKATCELEPCQNNGTCIDDDSGRGFSCKCTSDFTGETCEQRKTSSNSTLTTWIVVIVVVMAVVFPVLIIFAVLFIRRNCKKSHENDKNIALDTEEQ